MAWFKEVLFLLLGSVSVPYLRFVTQLHEIGCTVRTFLVRFCVIQIMRPLDGEGFREILLFLILMLSRTASSRGRQ